MSLEKCKEELKKVLDQYGHDREALLPCLHIAQEQCGCLTEDVISFLAKELNLPRVEVYSTASFYSMFSFEKRGKHVIRVCTSLPCYLKGSEKILKTLNEELNVTVGHTTSDRIFTLEAVSCIGACDKAPAMMIDEKLYGNLTPEKVREIISKYKGGRDA